MLHHVGLRQRRMHVDRQIELLGARIDRPEALVVEEDAIGEAVQHGALKSKCRRAFELVGGCVRHRGRQRGKGGEALRIFGDHLMQAVVDAARDRGGGLGGQLLRRRRAVREHLNVD